MRRRESRPTVTGWTALLCDGLSVASCLDDSAVVGGQHTVTRSFIQGRGGPSSVDSEL